MKYNLSIIILLMLSGCVISAEIDKTQINDGISAVVITKNGDSPNLISKLDVVNQAVDIKYKNTNFNSQDADAKNESISSNLNSDEILDGSKNSNGSKPELRNEKSNENSKNDAEIPNPETILEFGSSYQSVIFTNTDNSNLPQIVINGKNETTLLDARTVLLLFTAFLSSLTLLITLRFRSEDKKSSIDDDFWIRDVLTPKLHEVINSYIESVRALPKSKNKKTIEHYINENIIPFRTKIVDCLATISKTHTPLYRKLYAAVLELDDTYYDDDGNLRTADRAVREICKIWGDINSHIYEYQLNEKEKPNKVQEMLRRYVFKG